MKEHVLELSLEVIIIVSIWSLAVVFYHRKTKLGLQRGLGKAQVAKQTVSTPTRSVVGGVAKAKLSYCSPDDVLRIWNETKDDEAWNFRNLVYVIGACEKLQPDQLVPEIVTHVAKHKELRYDRLLPAMLVQEVNAVVGNQFAEEMTKSFASLGVLVTRQTTMVKEQSPSNFPKEVTHVPLKRRCMAATLANADSQGCVVDGPSRLVANLRGHIAAKRCDDAVAVALDMLSKGYSVTPQLVTDIYKLFIQAGRPREALRELPSKILPTSQVGLLLAEYCLQCNDIAAARTLYQKCGCSESIFCNRGKMALLKLFCQHGEPDANKLFDELLESEGPLRESCCVCLIAKCADSKSVEFADRIAAVYSERRQMPLPMYGALLKVYASASRPEKTCELWRRMLKEGVEPDQAFCASVLRQAADCGEMDLASELVEKLDEVHTTQWVHLIRSCRNCSQGDASQRAISFFDRAFVRCKNWRVSCNALEVCVLDNNMNAAHYVASRMLTVTPRATFVCQKMLEVFDAVGDEDASRQLRDEMGNAEPKVKSGLRQPPHKSDSDDDASVDAGASQPRYGSFEEAYGALTDMSQNGQVIPPDAIVALFRLTKTAVAAESAFKLLCDARVSVASDADMLDAVLEVCAAQSNHTFIAHLLNEVCSQGHALPRIKYGTLVAAYRHACHLTKGMPTLNNLVKVALGPTPSGDRASEMVKALTEKEFFREAAELIGIYAASLDKAVVGGNVCRPLLKFLSENRLADETMTVLQFAREGKICNMRMYHLVLDNFCKCGEMDMGLKVLKCIEDDGLQMDASTNPVMIKGYCLLGDIDNAYKLFLKTFEKDGRCDVVSYNTLLNGCVCQHNTDLADRLVTNMQQYGFVPSTVTLGTIIKLWGRRNELEKCAEVLQAFSDDYGILPDAAANSVYVSACLANKDMRRASLVYEQMLEKAQPLEPKLYSFLVAGHAETGNVDEALRLLEAAASVSGSSHMNASLLPELSGDCFKQVLLALMHAGRQGEIVPLLTKWSSRGAKIPQALKLSAQLGA